MSNQATNKSTKKAHNRYFVTIAAQNIPGQNRLELELFRPELDAHLIDQIVEDSGFNSNHPNINELVNQIKRTFTLLELSQFLEGTSSLDIVEINIVIASYHVNDPIIPQIGQIWVRIDKYKEQFDFSTLDGYSAPFKVMGYYDKN